MAAEVKVVEEAVMVGGEVWRELWRGLRVRLRLRLKWGEGSRRHDLRKEEMMGDDGE